ncbi:MAG: RimK family alpha-L-glutamate ligase [Candidatus Lokiarchaeota archaeon]|nr:RimK family alpha-L-glutamate ligase [Candidatus Lokiarchaeota archaeon]MBD3342702.1 RimK family alpha-L-glutamate ligase [Candidatus Lokiarchaeota archaeon]
MLVGILFNRITWEIKEIIKILEKKEINYELLNNQNIYFKLSNKKDLDLECDVFLERSLSFFRGLYSTAILESKGYNIINSFDCLRITGNKLLTSLELIKNDIPTPDTCVAFKKDSAIEAIEMELNYPTVLKPIIGSWGRLIAKLDNYNSATSNLECRENLGDVIQKIFYLQKFIKSKDKNSPTDIRVLVIGDQCVATMGRFKPEKEFRSNVAIGGEAKPIEIEQPIRDLCRKAIRAVKGEIVGVDIMIEDDKPYVIEVNGTPQFRGVSTATKINVAEKIVEHIYNNYN